MTRSSSTCNVSKRVRSSSINYGPVSLRLTADLAEAEKYQEAYTGLLEEVDSLVEKNALAEEEAQRLSTFNAQILGHHNPAQRIMYVDKIRKELHDTKLVSRSTRFTSISSLIGFMIGTIIGLART